MQGYTTKIG